MSVEEARSAIEELKAQGISEEGIAASLYEMFKADKIDLDQFEALVKLVGYDLSEEFKAMSDEEKKNQDIGQFGMEGDGEEEDTEEDNSNSDADEEDNSNEDASNDEKEEEKEENPFEKYDNKPSNNFDKKDEEEDDEEKEAKKMYGF